MQLQWYPYFSNLLRKREIGTKHRNVREIGGKITVRLSEGKQILVRIIKMLKIGGFEKSGFYCIFTSAINDRNTDGAMVRAPASHQCGLSSNPDVSWVCYWFLSFPCRVLRFLSSIILKFNKLLFNLFNRFSLKQVGIQKGIQNHAVCKYFKVQNSQSLIK